MIKISVFKDKQYPVSAKKIKDAVKKTLVENGIVSDSEASVALLSHAKIVKMAKQYLNEKNSLANSHPVLSFPNAEIKKHFVFPPEKKIYLGEIIVSFEKAVEIAEKEKILIEDSVLSLVEHGSLHLIGIHHD